MIAAPAARPGTHARGTNRGRQTNPNYARITNPISKRDVIKLRLAREWVAGGRAEWVAEGAEICIIESHPANLAYTAGIKAKFASTDAGYDGIKSGFQWQAGQSAGATVLMTQRGPAV